MSKDMGINIDALCADKVVQCVTRHIEELLAAKGMTLANGTAREHAEKRFGAWVDHPKCAKTFILMERYPDSFTPKKDLAKLAGYRGVEWVHKVISGLRKWRLPVYDADKERTELQPFKKGRELWSCRRGKRLDGTMIEGGVRMVLIYQKSINYGDACDIQRTFLPSVLSDLELLEGASVVVGADVSVTETQRAEYTAQAQQVADRVSGQVTGPQLGLFGKTGTGGK